MSLSKSRQSPLSSTTNTLFLLAMKPSDRINKRTGGSASPAAIWNPSSLCWKTLLFYHLPQGRVVVDHLDPSFFAILMEARLFSRCTVLNRREVRPPGDHVSPSPLPQLFACSLLYLFRSLASRRQKSGELSHMHLKVVLICSRK